MEPDVALIADFIAKNHKGLSGYIRQKLISAGAKSYVDGLGKNGIHEMDRESAGLLLDISCALMRRLKPNGEWQAEALMGQFSEDFNKSIKLPRSDAYYAGMAELEKMKTQRMPPKE